MKGVIQLMISVNLIYQFSGQLSICTESVSLLAGDVFCWHP